MHARVIDLLFWGGGGGVCIFENELLKMSLTTSKNQISANDLPETIQEKKKKIK